MRGFVSSYFEAWLRASLREIGGRIIAHQQQGNQLRAQCSPLTAKNVCEALDARIYFPCPPLFFLSISHLYHQEVNFGWLWGLRSLHSYSLKYSILAMSSTPFEMEGCGGDGVCLLQVHDFVFLLPIVYPLTPPWNLIILAPHHKILGCWFTSLIKHNENYELSWRLH